MRAQFWACRQKTFRKKLLSRAAAQGLSVRQVERLIQAHDFEARAGHLWRATRKPTYDPMWPRQLANWRPLWVRGFGSWRKAPTGAGSRSNTSHTDDLDRIYNLIVGSKN